MLKQPSYLINTGMPNVLLIVRKCFIDFAVEHFFGCPGYAADIGTTES